MQNKNLRPYKNGIPHGYWEVYWSDNRLWYKTFYVNNVECGFGERYSNISNLTHKVYYAR